MWPPWKYKIKQQDKRSSLLGTDDSDRTSKSTNPFKIKNKNKIKKSMKLILFKQNYRLHYLNQAQNLSRR